MKEKIFNFFTDLFTEEEVSTEQLEKELQKATLDADMNKIKKIETKIALRNAKQGVHTPKLEVTIPTYEDLTLTELKNIAKEKGLKGYSTLKKDELIKLLNESEK